MPLARIITSHPEHTAAISRKLQQEGFSVEVARPEDQQLPPADLEIQFELCDQSQALDRAAELARQLRTDVVVLPGVLEAPPQAEILCGTAAPGCAPTQMAEIHAPQQLGPDQSVAAREISAPPSGSQPLHEAPEPIPSGSTFTLLGSELRKSWQQAGSAFGDVKKDMRPALTRAREALRNGIAVLRTRASSTTEALIGRAHEYQERLKLRAAEARAAREQRLAEIERQRAEAHREAAALEQERQKQKALQESARQQETERQRAEREQRLAELERRRIEAVERAAALERERQQPRQPESQITQQPVSFAVPRKGPRAARHKPSTLQGVLIGAIAMSFLFLISVTLTNFRPHSPLPADVTQPSIEQQVPFGSATVHGKPAQPRPAAQPPRPQAQVQPARITPASVVAHKPQPQHRHIRRRAQSDDGDDVADDVVVRHFNTAPKQPQHPQQAGLKKYSDM